MLDAVLLNMRLHERIAMSPSIDKSTKLNIFNDIYIYIYIFLSLIKLEMFLAISIFYLVM